MPTKINLTKEKTVIGIPAYNGGEELIKCIALIKQFTPGVKIIVVDSASEDDTVDRLTKDFSDVVVLAQDKNVGYAGGLQIAFEAAKLYGAEVFAVVTQDIEVTEKWLEPLLEKLENEEVGTAQPLLINGTEKTLNSSGNAIHYLGFGYAIGNGNKIDSDDAKKLMVEKDNLAYVSGGCFAIRVDEIDGQIFIPDFFMYHEDLDLGWRMLMQGKKNVLVPTAKVNHRYEFSRSTKIKYQFGEQNRLRVLLMNYQFKTLVLIFPAWLAMEIGVVLVSVWAGWFQEKVKGYWFVLTELDKILAERKKRQNNRSVSDADIIGKFSDSINYQEGAGPLLSVANPVFSFYWHVIKWLI
jgi:GT2 family glycosyltransferase